MLNWLSISTRAAFFILSFLLADIRTYTISFCMPIPSVSTVLFSYNAVIISENSSISCDMSILASSIFILLKCDRPEPGFIVIFCFVSISRPLETIDTLTPLAAKSCESPAAMLIACSTIFSCIYAPSLSRFRSRHTFLLTVSL